MPAKQTKPKKRLNAVDRRAQFVSDAIALVEDSGLEALTMENLAARSGVNKALPYRFFANRDDVLLAIFEEENERFDELLNQHRAEAVSFQDEITALVTTWVTAVQKKIGTPSLQTARTVSGALEQERQRRTSNSLTFIQDLILNHYDFTPERAKLCADVLFASSLGFAPSIGNRKIKKAELITTYVNMIVGGVEAASDRHKP